MCMAEAGFPSSEPQYCKRHPEVRMWYNYFGGHSCHRCKIDSFEKHMATAGFTPEQIGIVYDIVQQTLGY